MVLLALFAADVVATQAVSECSIGTQSLRFGVSLW